MKRNILRWFGLLVVLSMLLTMAPAALAGPAKEAGDIAKRPISDLPIFRAKKWREHLRVPRDDLVVEMLQQARFLPEDASPEQIEAALTEFRAEWARRNPTTPNPRMLQRLLENERLAAEAGMSPKALGLTIAQDSFQTLVVLVEFPGTDTFTYSAEDPDTGECVDMEVTTTGPLHNQITLGPRDNNTVWYEDATPELYEDCLLYTSPSPRD